MRRAFLAAACLLLLPLSAYAAASDDATTAALPAPAVPDAGAPVDLNPPPALSGPDVYRQSCMACHGDNGKGVVAGSPDFTQPGGVLSKPDATLIKHIAQGYKSPGSPLTMPARAGNPELTDAEIAEVVAYLQSTFAPPSASAANPALTRQPQAVSGP